ncbi:hypothetical protein [Aestuariirhabdus sp. LZHN29]|uniref:hypothetical protein n=1 Tax=Aestuariirhabdus sp. LZHN29 TaxID=3417462 RepID=UPI003CF3CBE4
MNFIVKNTKWVMLVSGILTATMFYGLFAPQAALESMFGASFNGVLQSIVIRSWSALIGLIGVVLICGFFNENVRKYSFAIAAFSKFIFVLLVLLYGQDFLSKVLPAITMDVIVIVVAVIYFLNSVEGTKNA